MSQHITDFDQHHSDGFYRGNHAAFLDSRATGRVVAACSAIQTLTSLLMQRELDGGQNFQFSPDVALGILTAIGCCADLAQSAVNGVSIGRDGTTTFPPDSQGAALMSRTAARAASMRRATDQEGGAA